MTTVPDKTDPGGPVLAICDGARCAALWRMRDDDAEDDAFETAAVRTLRATIRATPGGLLVRTACVGGCAHGAVTGVAYRPADGTTTAGFTWIGGTDLPGRRAALGDWLEADWTTGPVEPPRGLGVSTSEHPAA